MIYIITSFMLTMQVGLKFPNITNTVKKKTCGPSISFAIFIYTNSLIKYLHFAYYDSAYFSLQTGFTMPATFLDA